MKEENHRRCCKPLLAKLQSFELSLLFPDGALCIVFKTFTRIHGQMLHGTLSLPEIDLM